MPIKRIIMNSKFFQVYSLIILRYLAVFLMFFVLNLFALTIYRENSLRLLPDVVIDTVTCYIIYKLPEIKTKKGLIILNTSNKIRLIEHILLIFCVTTAYFCSYFWYQGNLMISTLVGIISLLICISMILMDIKYAGRNY
jgi:hypothetical protein